MTASRVGSRGTLFVFDELGGLPTTVYVIDGPRHAFVIDTFLGPGSMTPVASHIRENCGKKPVVVFNTHYHWDHVWGNCAFPDAAIVSHRLTRGKMTEIGLKELEAYGQYRQGEVSIVLPGLTFDSSLAFEDDGVEFFHSPGHTEDSSSCLDRTDSVLLTGDNVEMPLPYLYWAGLGRYLETLDGYLKTNAKRVISGHHPEASAEIIRGNEAYIKDFIAGNSKPYLSGNGKDTHAQNIEAMERLRPKG